MTVIVMGFSCFAAIAQEKQSLNSSSKNEEYLIKKNDEMICFSSGKERKMEQAIKMKNGITVEIDGSYKANNGKILNFRNGQCMDMAGNIYQNKEMFMERNLGKQNMGGNKGNMMNNKSQMKDMPMRGGMIHN